MLGGEQVLQTEANCPAIQLGREGKPSDFDLAYERVGPEGANTSHLGPLVVGVQPDSSGQRESGCANVEHLTAGADPDVDPRPGGTELAIQQLHSGLVDVPILPG